MGTNSQVTLPITVALWVLYKGDLIKLTLFPTFSYMPMISKPAFQIQIQIPWAFMGANHSWDKRKQFEKSSWFLLNIMNTSTMTEFPTE